MEKEKNLIDIIKKKFEGEYLNGQRHGHGKEYYCFNGNLIFEGEYSNGKRNGKGKEYDGNKLIFEGEYLSDKRLIGNQYDKEGNIIYKYNNLKGKGKEYDNSGRLLFDGEYLNGERNGQGKEYSHRNNILIFVGEYLNNQRNGKGKEYNNGKLVFEGDYKNDKRWEGKGYDKSKKIVYELKDGKGLVKEYYDDGILRFEGEYLNGE